MIIFSLILSTTLGGQSAYASASLWEIDSADDYTLSSGPLEISDGSAKFIPNEYLTDANTKALYHLNETEGTSVADASGNSNTATLNGSGTWGDGKLNGGLSLDGSSSYLKAPASDSVNIGGANISIEAWTKFDSQFGANTHSTRQPIVDKGNYQLFYDQQAGKVNFQLDTQENKSWSLAGGDNLNGSWDLDGKTYIYTMINIGNDIYAGITGTDAGEAEVWRWEEDLTKWTQIGGTGVFSSWSTEQEEVRSMITDGTYLYAGLGNTVGDAEIWKCTDPGGTPSWTKIAGDGVNSGWSAVNGGYQRVHSMVFYKGNLVAGLGSSTSDGDVWIFNGTTWTQIGGDSLNSGWTTSIEYIDSMAADDTYLYVGTGYGGSDAEVWRYTDTPSSAWQKIADYDNLSTWLAGYNSVLSMTLGDGALYVGLGYDAGEAEVWRSSNPTEATPTWTKIGGDAVGVAGNLSWDNSHEGVYALAYNNGNLYAGTGLTYQGPDGELWKITNPADATSTTASWTQIAGDGVNSSYNTYFGYSLSIAFANGKIYNGAYRNYGYWPEVWSSDIETLSWTQIGGNGIYQSWAPSDIEEITSLTVHDNKLYAGVSNLSGWPMVYEYDGNTWRKVGGGGVKGSWDGLGLTYDYVNEMYSYKGKLYVGMGGVAGDDDVWQYNGSVWTQVGGDNLNGWEESYAGLGIFSMTEYDGKLCVGDAKSNTSAVFCWDDNTWTRLTGNLADYVRSLVVWRGELYAATSGSTAGEGDLYKWNGISWDKIAGDGTGFASSYHARTLSVYQDELYVSAWNGSTTALMYKFDGTTWTQVGGNSVNNSWDASIEYVWSTAVYNGELYAGLGYSPTGDGEVWKWNGVTWTKVGGDNVGGLTSDLESVRALAVYGGKLFAGAGDTDEVDAKVFVYGNNAILTSTATSQDTGWHHIAATYDGTTMKIYIDGVLDSSTSNPGSIVNNSLPLYIGLNYGIRTSGMAPGFFGGSLDEIRISNTARSTFNTTTYVATAQTVQPAAATLTSQVKSFDGFVVSAEVAGTITYRLSDNGGTSWKYWSGAAWVSSASTSDANSAADINTNIGTFPVTSGGILWQAVLSGNGEELVQLNSVTISYTEDTTAPVTPTETLTAKSQKTSGTDILDAADDETIFYNYSSPYFTWDAASDGEGIGTDGYYVYFGTVADANPKTAKGLASSAGDYRYQNDTDFEVGADSSAMVSGNTYYLRILAKDKAGNPTELSGDPETIFTYKYDASAMTGTLGVGVNPSGWSAANEFDFSWPVWDDGSGSGLDGYYYRVRRADSTYYPGPTADDAWAKTSNITLRLTDIATKGENLFEMKVRDKAGNDSSISQVQFLYAQAPSAPQNLAVTAPTNGETNSFSFSWDPPAIFQGQASQLTYYYWINNPVLEGTGSNNGNSTSIPLGQRATKQGVNTISVVAKDVAGNINYLNAATETFNAMTAAPGQPTNPAIVDSSNRATEDFRLAVTWTAPASGGEVDRYVIHRSTDGDTFGEVGRTTSTGYLDSPLNSAIKYYYKIYAVDSAEATSAEPGAGDIVSAQPTGKYANPPTIETIADAIPATTSVTLRWTTDRPSDSFVRYGTTTAYGLSYGVREETKNHEIKITGLQAGLTYHYQIQSLDPGDYRSYSDDLGFSTDKVFSTLPAPSLKNVIISDITTNSAILSFETTTAMATTVEYGLTTDYTENPITDDSTNAVTKHTLRFANLLSGRTYYLKITVEDDGGDSFSSTGYTINTLAMPEITNVGFQPLSEAQTAYRVTWKTNVPTTGMVEYTSNKGDRKEIASGQYVTDHELTVRGLVDQSTYKFQVFSVDQFGNRVSSDINTINTPLDSRPPRISNLVIEVKSSGFGTTQKAQIIATWETDEPSTSQIEYGQGISGKEYPNSTKEDTALTNNHAVIVSELDPSRIYHLRAASKDRAANASYSEDTTTITGKVQNSVLDIIVNSLQRSLGWMFNAFR